MIDRSKRYCQYTQTVPCPAPRAIFKLTFRTGDGFEWIEAACRAHADPRADQVRAQGGQLVAVEEYPDPDPGPTVEAMAAASAPVVETEPSLAPEKRARRRRKSGGAG